MEGRLTYDLHKEAERRFFPMVSSENDGVMSAVRKFSSWYDELAQAFSGGSCGFCRQGKPILLPNNLRSWRSLLKWKGALNILFPVLGQRWLMFVFLDAAPFSNLLV